MRAYGILPDPTIEGLLQRLLSHVDLKLEDCTNTVTHKYRIRDLYQLVYELHLFREMPCLKDIPDTNFEKERRERITSLRNFRRNVKFVTEILKFNAEEVHIGYKYP